MKRRMIPLISILGATVPFASANPSPEPEPERVEVITVPAGDGFLRWQGQPGRTYFIQASDPNFPLEAWDWMPLIESGAGIEISHEIVTSADKAFFRLWHTDDPAPSGVSLEDWDADDDGLGNQIEIVAWQTNPLKPDTSGDGIPDGWAAFFGLDPLADNAADLFQGGPLTNLEAYLAGVQPLPGATSDDHDGDNIANAEDADRTDPDVTWRPASVTSYILIDVDHPLAEWTGLEINDKGEVLFENGVWSAAGWTEPGPVGPFEEVFFGETHIITWSSWRHFNSTGALLGYGECPDPWGGDPLGATILWPAAQSPGYLGLFSENPYSDPFGYWSLGLDDTGRAFCTELEAVWDEQTGWEYVSRVTAFPPAGGTSSIDYDAPDGWQPWPYADEGFDVSRSGWVAATGSTAFFDPNASFRPLLWDSEGRVVTLPAEANGWRPWLAVEEIADGPAVLCAATPGGPSTVMVPDDAGGGPPPAMRVAGKLSTHGILRFSPDGTGMTADHQMWLNGRLIALKDLCEGVADAEEDGLEILPIDANLSGAWLVHVHDPSYVLPSETKVLLPVELITRDPDTGVVSTAEEVIAPSNPRPEVEIELVSAEITDEGLLVTLSGTAVDRLSEVMKNSADRVQEIHFTANGAPLGSIEFDYSQGAAPWTEVDSFTEFQETFTIPHPRPGGYVIKAETDLNAAGNSGWDKVAVGLNIETENANLPADPSQLSIVLGTGLDPLQPDVLTVYFGDRAPQAGDGTVTETAPDSHSFSGTVVINGMATSCSLVLAGPPTLTAQEDRLEGEFRYTHDGVEWHIHCSWKETGGSSLRFYPDGFQIGDECLMVNASMDLPGTEWESFEPLVLRIKAPLEGMEAAGLGITVNGVHHDFGRRSFTGQEALYVIENGDDPSPKVFIPSLTTLPGDHDIAGLLSGSGEVEWTLTFGGTAHVLSPTLVLGIPDSPSPPPLAGDTGAAQQTGEPGLETPEDPPIQQHGEGDGGNWQEPGDTITEEDLFTAFEFIYPDELSRHLLQTYRDEGHVISLEDEFGDFDFDHDIQDGQDKITIRIENDDGDMNPAIAAQYLWMGLNKAMARVFSFRKAVIESSPNLDLEINAIVAWKAQIGPEAAQAGVAATELYLSGIGIVSEPAEWLLIINDVSEGEWSSLAAALPFVPRALLTAKRLRIVNAAGETLEVFEDVAKLDAARSLYGQSDLRVIGVTMDEYEFSWHLRQALELSGGPIKPAGRWSRGNLRKRMEKLGPIPEYAHPKPEVHHDYPWKHRK